MKEASGEVSMTLIVIVAAAVILGIVYALRDPINNMIQKMWGRFGSEAGVNEGFNKGRTGVGTIVIPGYTIELNR